MNVAVLDACVLYPPSLRDLLMWLASVRIYAPRFTAEIHAEWIRNVLADIPDVTPVQLDRTRRLMNLVAPNCMVAGYEVRIPTLSLPDANDRHILIRPRTLRDIFRRCGRSASKSSLCEWRFTRQSFELRT